MYIPAYDYQKKALHKKVIQMKNLGTLVDEIAKQTRQTENYIRAILGKFEEELIENCSEELTQSLPAEEVIRLVRRGWSHKQIALVFRTSATATQQVVKNSDLNCFKKFPLSLPCPYTALTKLLDSGTTAYDLAQSEGIDLLDLIVAMNKNEIVDGVVDPTVRTSLKLPPVGPATPHRIRIKNRVTTKSIKTTATAKWNDTTHRQVDSMIKKGYMPDAICDMLPAVKLDDVVQYMKEKANDKPN